MARSDLSESILVATSASSHRPVILLVDDDADTLEMYEMGLAYAGFSPIGTTDAASVARQVAALHPDAVVTDLQLHGTTGWNVMQSIKEHSSNRAIPVVLLTGYSSADIDEQAQSLGCAAVLTKPCTPDELGVVLRRVLAPS
jgi:two-component system response regulator HydG